jgi:hypothetical protein
MNISFATTKQYKATIYVADAQRTDVIIVEAHGIRWAIEKASSQYVQKFPQCWFEIVSVEKI